MTGLTQWKQRRAARHLAHGGIVAYPTEAVFGLGCDPLDRVAVQDLLKLKQRPQAKGFILIASDFEQIEPYLQLRGSADRTCILATWPGPVTWIVPARPWVPEWLRGEHSTLAVRVTDHPIAGALCRAFNGPLVSTSANRHDQPPARTALKVRIYFPGTAGLMIINGATGGQAKPTEIHDLVSGRRIR